MSETAPPPVEIQPKLELVVTRCWECGTFWAVERRVHGTGPSCPCCAGRKALYAHKESERIGRVISALRGTITRQSSALAIYRGRRR